MKCTSIPKTFGFASPRGEFHEHKFGMKRQYTECFTMRREVYESLLKVGRDFYNSDAEVKTLREAINMFNNDSLCLSIKNYSQFSGLSKQIHANSYSGVHDNDIF